MTSIFIGLAVLVSAQQEAPLPVWDQVQDSYDILSRAFAKQDLDKAMRIFTKKTKWDLGDDVVLDAEEAREATASFLAGLPSETKCSFHIESLLYFGEKATATVGFYRSEGAGPVKLTGRWKDDLVRTLDGWRIETRHLVVATPPAPETKPGN